MRPGKRQKLLKQRRRAIYHCWNRCVRRALLCGQDPYSGQDYSHRRDWILNRQEQLAALFAIEIGFHAEMANHLHLVLRTRPDVARKWSRQEVARRWLTITRLAKCMNDALPAPDPDKYLELIKDKKQIRKIRRRLSNVSWFMAILDENIARRANAEDECSGRFWQGRYKLRELEGFHSILLCGIYVDLNPIKAGEAASPQTARYTSAYQRIQARAQRPNARNRADDWLGELTWQDEAAADEAVYLSSQTGKRASDLGWLPISLEDYLRLLDWTAQQILSGQQSTVPQDLESILDQLHLNSEYWLAGVESYETGFCELVGTPAALSKAARESGRRCMKGASASQQIFTA